MSKNNKNKTSIGKQIVNHLQTGVSYMIPLVAASGLLTSIAVIFGGQEVWEHTDTIWGVVRLIGATGLGFIVPMISGYIAFSIADRPGLAPAFITGLIAEQMGTGFFGGIFTGLAVGYLVNYLKKLKVPDSIRNLKPMLIIPLVSTFTVGLFLWYVVGTPIAAATVAVETWLEGMSGANMALLAAILGGMMAFDMGGPINKVANTFGIASFAAGNYAISTAVMLAIAIPPLGMFLATLLNKKLYTQAEIDNGRTAMIMGAVGITEGTIPFSLADPLRVIPSIMVGTAVTTGMNAAFGGVHETLLTTFMAIPFVTSNKIMYTISILAGGLATAFMVNALKSMDKKRKMSE